MNRSEAGKLGAEKSKATHNRLKKERVDLYNLDPTCCKNCGKPFEYDKRKNEYCNKSCSASFNNLGVSRYPEKQLNVCISCGVETKNPKYCKNSCRTLKKIDEVKEVVKTGVGKVSSKQLKKYLMELYGEKCQECNWCERNPYTGNIPIELEHIDGNSDNNELNNLKILCPNCHSLTATYKGANRGNGRHYRRERYKQGKSF